MLGCDFSLRSKPQPKIKQLKRINRIVETGKISNEEQYYLLREYLERIWDVTEKKSMAQKIEDVLFAYEQKNKGLERIDHE